MGKSKSSVTIADVAKLAGVSYMTVTRVMHGSSSVTDETRKKVLDACRTVGYKPNLIARSLRSSQSRVFGVVVPTLAHNYYGRIISSIEKMARNFGYHIIVVQIQNGYQLTLSDIEPMFGRRVDGLFMGCAPLEQDIYDSISANGIPVVSIITPGPNDSVPFMGIGDEIGAREAVAHLISLGHRRIAHISGVPGGYTASQRCLGYRESMEQHGIGYSEEDVFASNYMMEGGYLAAESILQSGRDYTAIFCANDYLAIGAISCLQNHGLSVPKDCSVVGFSDEPVGRFFVPALTTIHESVEEAAETAVESMLAIVAGESTKAVTLLKPQLIVRDSTAPPPAR